MSDDIYKQVVHILWEDDYNQEDVLGIIAREFPETFIQAVVMSQAPGDMWKRRAEYFLEQGKKIQAIRTVREATNWDLRQSKDWVDQRQQEMESESR